jgi:succinate dehydrogenase/fumarate reductase flavoprotein subunit
LPVNWDYETEVCVVGAGAAGPTVAMEAHRAGAKTLVLEKLSKPFGDIAYSGGLVQAAGTSVQKSLGVIDSADRMYELWMTISPMAPSEKIKLIADGSADALEWLISLGVEFPAIIGQTPGLTYGGLEHEPELAAKIPPVPRAHGCVGRGMGLHEALLRQVRDRGLDILTNTRGHELIADCNGEIIGVKAKTKRKLLCIKAKRGVAICSGHFIWNKELMRLYVPEYMHLPTVTAPALEGDGMIMAQARGADVENVTHMRPNMGVQHRPGKALLIHNHTPFILVNKEAKRFVYDHAKYGVLGKALAQQPDGVCFMLFDKAGHALRSASNRTKRMAGIENRVIKAAGTIAELANAIGLDPVALEKTVTAYNENAKLGKDPEFGSTQYLQAICTPPFYALKIQFVTVSPSGGLKTNSKAQVVDVFGRVIPRLYAAGSVTALYREYPGAGASFAKAFVFGRIAGRNVAHETLS